LTYADNESETVNLDNGLGKRLRGFLRQIVPDAARDDPVRIFAREFLSVGAGVRVWRAVGIALQGDGGRGNHRGCGEPLFKLVILLLAVGQAEPPAVIMSHDLDVS